MTHPKEAVELVARALAESYFEGRRDLDNPLDTYDWALRDDLHKAGWKLDAHKLLNAIAPHYREQAAQKVDAECARILSKQDGQNPAVDANLRLLAGLLPELAAAYRAAKEAGHE